VPVDVAEIGGLKINHFVPFVITNDITGISEERPLFFTAGKPYRHQKICQCGIIPFTYYLLRTQAHGTLLACGYVS
jgi:hypothetical protein